MKKKVNIFGKSVPVFVIAIIAVGVASAALLSYFGMITGLVTVSQGLLVDGKSMPESGEITYSEDFTSLEAKTVSSELHYLTNDADVDALVTLDTICTPLGENCNETNSITEYKLDATADCTEGYDWQADDDDYISIKLDTPITWGSFNSVSFDYLIDSGALHTPQMNIRLVNDNGDFGGYVTWHAKWLDRLGVVGIKDTIINDKVGDFNLGCFVPGGQNVAPCIRCFAEDWSIIPCNDLNNDLKFDSFSINAGDTSYCNNNESAWGGTYGNAEQIVWVSDFVVNPSTTLKGIKVSSETSSNPAIEKVEFKIVTDFPQMMIPDEYTIKTTVKPAE